MAIVMLSDHEHNISVLSNIGLIERCNKPNTNTNTYYSLKVCKKLLFHGQDVTIGSVGLADRQAETIIDFILSMNI